MHGQILHLVLKILFGLDLLQIYSYLLLVTVLVVGIWNFRVHMVYTGPLLRVVTIKATCYPSVLFLCFEWAIMAIAVLMVILFVVPRVLQILDLPYIQMDELKQ
jgi:hypothetical protein